MIASKTPAVIQGVGPCPSSSSPSLPGDQSDSRTNDEGRGRSPSDERFTIDGSPELESHLLGLCQLARDSVMAEIPDPLLEGMLLAGGYGRGEGGVLQTPEGERPYNDLEFYVFLKGVHWLNQRKYQPLLHHAAEKLSANCGIEIELRVLSFRKLRRSAPSTFYYDLALGHRWIIGQEHLLRGCEHHRNARAIPLAEAARMLMNRCSGLLFAKERLQNSTFTVVDSDFVGRNIEKAKLALGDVVLTASGEYHWSCLERNRRLQKAKLDVPWLDEVRHHHRQGMEFKLHPKQSRLSPAELGAELEEMADLGLKVWLWLESKRLACSFSGPREYALDPVNKCPETSRWRNALVNFRAGDWRLDRLFRYPRVGVLNCLPLLLWCWQDPPERAVMEFLQRELRTKESAFGPLVRVYRELWSQFN